MARSRILFHVGLQKTASTFFQDVVFPQLPDVAYVGRPYTQENHAFNTLQYADDALYDASAFREEIERIEREAAGGRPILVSDELLSGYALYNFINRGMVARRLREACPEAEVVLFLRNQVDLVVSTHNQFVKIGWFDDHLDESFLWEPGPGFPLQRWVAGERGWNPGNRYVNPRSMFNPDHFLYSRIYDLYAGLFERVHVFLYEDLRTDQAAFVSRLLSALSLPSPASTERGGSDRAGRQVNRSLSGLRLRSRILQNRLSHLLPAADSKAGRGVSMVLSRLVAERQEENRARVVALMRRRGVFEDNERLNERLRLGMEKYAGRYFDYSTGP
jgi:hypothetical protein